MNLESLPDFLKPYFSSTEETIVYVLVFAAVFVPIAFWRRDQFVDSTVPPGDWKRLPSVFKILWRPSYILETSIGAMFAYVLPGVSRRYAELAEISALPLTPRRVFVCNAISAAFFAVLGSTLFLFTPTIPLMIAQVACVVLVALGWMMPSLALSSAAQLRQEEIVKTLPFAIDLIGSAMRSGLEFGASMRYYVGSEESGALVEEFGRVLREAALGRPITDGLRDMSMRIRVKSFTAFVGVVSYGIEIGASIADTLKLHGAEMRRERFAIAEQKAARAPAMMIFPIAVFILPAVFLIIFVPVLLQFLETQSM